MSARVLVTGATSGLGTSVVAALRQRGDAVTALVRRDSQTGALYRLGCEMLEGDVTDAASVGRAARGCDAVVHAAARVGDWGPREAFEEVNVLGTERVLRAARDAGVRRFVHVSSVSVYGMTSAPVLEETLPLRLSGTPYADSKVAAERLVFAHGEREGVAVVSIRPCLIYGPHDRNFLPRLAAMLQKGRFAYVVDPATPMNLVHVQHVVDVILRALEHPAAVGEAFNVSDGEAVALEALVSIACRQLGVPVPTRRVPARVAMWAARALEATWKLAGAAAPPFLTPTVVNVMARTNVVSCAKAQRVLGYRPTLATVEGVAQVFQALS